MDGTLALKKYNVVERLEALEEGGGGGGYVLPVASADTLGGVKIGEGLSIDAETGELSNTNPTPYTPVNYSTTEQNTGKKWIDGSDIYVKTIVFENISASQSSDPVVIDNIESIVKIEGMMALSDRVVPLPYIDNDATYQRSVIYMSTGLIITGYANSPAVTAGHVSVYYTKVTPTRKKK